MHKDLTFTRLINSPLPDSLYTFIVKSSGILYSNKDAADLFEKNLLYYSKFKWSEKIINFSLDDLWNNFFHKDTFLFKYNKETVFQELKDKLKETSTTKDLFIIKKILSCNTRNLIEAQHNIEPIILLDNTIVDGLHRIVSLFIEEDTNLIEFKAWKGMLEN